MRKSNSQIILYASDLSNIHYKHLTNLNYDVIFGFESYYKSRKQIKLTKPFL